jgi:hypothetical protein
MNNMRASWDKLVSGNSAGHIGKRAFHLLQREGQELLAVPAGQSSPAHGLALYLPQTMKARLAKRLFILTLSSPLVGLLPVREVELTQTEFIEFLALLSEGQIPEFAVLSGNPAEPGRRFIFGLLDPDGKCCTIVKCAVDGTGRDLIEAETAILDALRDKFPAIPKIRAKLAVAGCHAFAMDFFGDPERTLTRAERIALASQ